MMVGADAAFVSYSRLDLNFASRLSEDLKAGGVRICLDQVDIKPGSHWDRSVEDVLMRCGKMLVVLSENAVKSENVLDEIAFALKERKEVIPI